MLDENIIPKQKRYFTDVINISFAFIKKEYKSFWKVMIMYASLPTIAYGIFNTVYFKNTINMMFKLFKNQGSPQEFSQGFTSQMFLLYLLAMVMYLFYYGLTYSYIKLYSDHKRQIQPKEVWRLFVKKFFAILGYSFLTGVFVFIGYFIVIIVFAIGGSGFFVGVGFFVSFLLLVYIFTVLSFLLMIKINEKVDYFIALGRCFQLIRSHWWETFGINLTAFIVSWNFSLILNLPSYGYLIGRGFLIEDPSIGILPAVLASVCSTIGLFFITPIVPILISFQYFSLAEHKDNTSLFERIDNINSHQE